jgi:pyruvate dehydrogenase E2 component (dihydrolipoamide acetyltransferase)
VPSAPRKRVLASPVARRIAAELGVALEGRVGRRPDGRIVKADVLAWSREAPTAVSPGGGGEDGSGSRRQPLTKAQRLIARRMTEVKSTVPSFTMTVGAAMQEAAELRAGLRAAVGEGERVPSLNDFVIRAVALALREHPKVNSSFADDHFLLHERVNVCFAVAAGEGLFTPAIGDADRLGLAEIGRRSRELAERCRDGTITPVELSGGTFTVSNLGMYGVEAFEALINSPQAAILAVGAVSEEGTMRLTISADHRILYGADAASFLATVRQRLQQPLSLLL